MGTYTTHPMWKKAAAVWMRLELRGTHAQIAKALGVNDSNINNWMRAHEQGNIDMSELPSLSKLARFARLAGLDMPDETPPDVPTEPESDNLPVVAEPTPAPPHAVTVTTRPADINAMTVVDELRTALDDAKTRLHEAHERHRHELAEKDAEVERLRMRTEAMEARLESVMTDVDLYRAVVIREMVRAEGE